MKKHLLTVTRILLGGVFVLYAIAKFTGNQFIKLDLAEYASNMDPVMLVWYFFGYSQPYAMFCAVAELIIGLLIAIPQTTRLGALFYFPFALNIAVIDWCFDFPLPGKLLTVSLVLLSLMLIIADRKRYRELLR